MGSETPSPDEFRDALEAEFRESHGSIRENRHARRLMAAHIIMLDVMVQEARRKSGEDDLS